MIREDIDHFFMKIAFMYASRGGHAETVNALLEAGADVNARHNDGWNALAFAALEGHTEIVNALLKAGAELKGTDALLRLEELSRQSP